MGQATVYMSASYRMACWPRPPTTRRGDVMTSRCHVGSGLESSRRWRRRFGAERGRSEAGRSSEYDECAFVRGVVVAAQQSHRLRVNLRLVSAVSAPVVVAPRCVLTEASVWGSALHLATTRQFAPLALSASGNVLVGVTAALCHSCYRRTGLLLVASLHRSGFAGC